MRCCHFKAGVIVIVAVLYVFSAVSVYSQPVSQPKSTVRSILQLPKKPSLDLSKVSLLDPARFTMKNQYMMSFSSVGGNGSMLGMYLNTMEYQFKIPLTMRLQVAYQSQSAQLFGNNNNYSGQPNLSQGNLFIPSFDLVYKPFKNTVIGFFYRDYSSMYQNGMYGQNGQYGSYSPYSRNRYSPFMRF